MIIAFLLAFFERRIFLILPSLGRGEELGELFNKRRKNEHGKN